MCGGYILPALWKLPRYTHFTVYLLTLTRDEVVRPLEELGHRRPGACQTSAAVAAHHLETIQSARRTKTSQDLLASLVSRLCSSSSLFSPRLSSSLIEFFLQAGVDIIAAAFFWNNWSCDDWAHFGCIPSPLQVTNPTERWITRYLSL